jgi:6-phosphogluconolactonase
MFWRILMNKSFRRFSSVFLLATLPLVSAFAATPIGKLYTMSNATTGNEVLVYNRLSDGSLSQTGQVPTTGTGTGGGLGNQGALALSEDGFSLFAVNAGSNSVSSFRLTSNGLVLINTVPSGGITPVSLTEDRGRLFVLNAGNGANPGNIFSFRVNPNGSLSPMAYSERALSSTTTSTGAAQINFSDDGKQLIVTEKATDLILTYQVYGYYASGKPTHNTSSGQTPFGFAVGKRNQVFVSNAAGGVADSGSLTSYRLLPQGQLHALSVEVATEETAACWVALTPDGRYAFTTNTASGTVSSFRIGMNGKVLLANNDAGITGAGSGPIDMIVGPESRFLYTLNAGTETISSFAVSLDGALTLLTTLTGLPDGANGLIVR